MSPSSRDPPRELPEAVDRARSDRTRTKPIVGVGRFTEPGHDGRGDPSRPTRHHRRGAALDRRSLPPEEDRGGAARRDPRVHRLQHLPVARSSSAAPGSSAPRTRPPARSTAAAGIRSGSRARRTPTTTCCRRRRASGDGVRDGARQARDATGASRRRATSEMGGIMRWIPSLPGLGEWGRVVNYRRIQIDKLQERRVHPARPGSTRTSVAEYGAEHRGDRDGLELGHRRHRTAVTRGRSRGPTRARRTASHPSRSWSRARRPPGERVLVYDCDGLLHGCLARREARLRGQAGDVRHATCDRWAISAQHRGEYYMHRDARAPRRRSRRRSRLDGGGAREHDRPPVLDHRGSAGWDADSVVLVTQRVSQDSLYRELAGDRRPTRPRKASPASTASAIASSHG